MNRKLVLFRVSGRNQVSLAPACESVSSSRPHEPFTTAGVLGHTWAGAVGMQRRNNRLYRALQLAGIALLRCGWARRAACGEAAPQQRRALGRPTRATRRRVCQQLAWALRRCGGVGVAPWQLLCLPCRRSPGTAEGQRIPQSPIRSWAALSCSVQSAAGQVAFALKRCPLKMNLLGNPSAFILSISGEYTVSSFPCSLYSIFWSLVFAPIQFNMLPFLHEDG